MKQDFRTVMLVGEKAAKIQFICEMLNEHSRTILKEYCENNQLSIEVRHADDMIDQVSMKKDKHVIEVVSQIFPFGVKLLAELTILDWVNCDIADKADMVIFLECFPYTTESLIKNLELIEEFLSESLSKNLLGNMQFRVAFYHDRNRHFGATDIVDINSALKQAPDHIIERLNESYNCSWNVSSLIDFKVYEKPSDMVGLFLYEKKMSNTLKLIKNGKFESWCQSIDGFKEDYMYECIVEGSMLLDVKVLHESVYEYGRVKGSDNLIKSYAENYYTSCFKDLNKLVSNIYQQSISEVCFWNLEKDIKVLLNQLDLFYRKSILTGTDRCRCPESKAEYQKMLTKSKIDIMFTGKLRDFINHLVPEFMYQYLRKKEEILSKAYR